MAQGETSITIVGNAVAAPELRFTSSGTPVASFRVASTPRAYNRDTGQWEDGDALFLTCNVWRQAAENVAATITKGMRVIVNGRLRQRSYQTRDGENRTVYEVEVDEVGPSLTFATATVERAPRSSNQFSGGNGGQQQASGWAVQDSRGGFGTANNAGGDTAAGDDKPPF